MRSGPATIGRWLQEGQNKKGIRMRIAATRTRRRTLARRAAVVAFGVAAAGLLGACGAAPEAADGSATRAPDEVLGRIGNVEILRSQVEQAVAGELRELAQQRHQLVERGLEAAINDRMIEMAAEARGLAPEAFLAAEVDAKVPEITQSEVDRFYEERRERIQQPLSAVAGQIEQFLGQTRKQEAMAELLSKLREEYQPVVLLDPLRLDVATAGRPSKGPDSAPVTIVEFSDFQCPFCSRIIPTLDRVVRDYPDSVRLVFRQFPLHSIHPQAQEAAEASLCAADQGKFWEMHDAMFENQSGLEVAELKALARRLGLEPAAFDECLDSGSKAGWVSEDLEAGAQFGVSGTPALFINGRFLSGAQPYDAIAEVIDDELRRARG